MPLPINPDEDARQECLGRLRTIADRLTVKDRRSDQGGPPVTMSDVDKAKADAVGALRNLLGAMGMEDLNRELNRIVKWGEQ